MNSPKNKITYYKEFSGGLVVRIPGFHSQGSWFNPCMGNCDSHKPCSMVKKKDILCLGSKNNPEG